MQHHRSRAERSVKEMQMSAKVFGINPHCSCCGPPIIIRAIFSAATFTSYHNHFYRLWFSGWHLYFGLFFENWTGIFLSDIKIIRAVRQTILGFFSPQSRSINQSEFLTSFGFSYQKHLFLLRSREYKRLEECHFRLVSWFHNPMALWSERLVAENQFGSCVEKSESKLPTLP